MEGCIVAKKVHIDLSWYRQFGWQFFDACILGNFKTEWINRIINFIFFFWQIYPEITVGFRDIVVVLARYNCCNNKKIKKIMIKNPVSHCRYLFRNFSSPFKFPASIAKRSVMVVFSLNAEDAKNQLAGRQGRRGPQSTDFHS